MCVCVRALVLVGKVKIYFYLLPRREDTCKNGDMSPSDQNSFDERQDCSESDKVVWGREHSLASAGNPTPFTLPSKPLL